MSETTRDRNEALRTLLATTSNESTRTLLQAVYDPFVSELEGFAATGTDPQQVENAIIQLLSLMIYQFKIMTSDRPRVETAKLAGRLYEEIVKSNSRARRQG